jgi:hypothetical protein
MTTDRYAELRAALEAGPTPGRRYHARSQHHGDTDVVYDKKCWYEPDGSRHGETPNLVITIAPADRAADAAFIAAADPETIAALLADFDMEKSRAGSLADQVRHDYQQVAALLAERDALRDAVAGLLNALPSATTHPAISAARAALAAQERT